MENEERLVDGMDVHHLALHSTALLRRRLRARLTRRLFFPRFNSLSLASFFSHTLASSRPHSHAHPAAWPSRMNPEVPGRSRTRYVASLHASPVMGRETRFTSSFVKRVVRTAVSRNSDVLSRVFCYAAHHHHVRF